MPTDMIVATTVAEFAVALEKVATDHVRLIVLIVREVTIVTIATRSAHVEPAERAAGLS